MHSRVTSHLTALYVQHPNENHTKFNLGNRTPCKLQCGPRLNRRTSMCCTKWCSPSKLLNSVSPARASTFQQSNRPRASGRERLKHAHSPTHPLSSPSDENPKRMHEATRVASRQRGHRQTGEEGAEEETRRTGQSRWWWW